MLRTKSACAWSSTSWKSSSVNSSAIDRTHASCDADVGVPQMASFRMPGVYPGLSEEIALRGHHEIGGAPVSCGFDPPDDRSRNPVRLAHHELGSRRDLVGDRDHRRLELVATRVSRTPEVTERCD